MSATAEDVTNSTSQEASVDVTDQIADILVGDDEKKSDDDATSESSTEESASDKTDLEADTTEDATTDSEDDASQSGESTETVDESAEPTWGDVLGIDEDKLSFDEAGNVSGVQVKINGEVSNVPMNDLVAGYQLNKSITQKSQALSEEKKTFDQRVGVVEQEYKQRLENVTLLSNHLEQQLVAEWEGIDWDALRLQDPAEYAALRQDYASRATTLKQLQDHHNNTIAEQKKTTDGETQTKRQNFINEQYGKMVESNPTWSDKDTFNKGMSEVRTFAETNYGFTGAEFDFALDSRLVTLFQDAQKYHAGVKRATEKLKKPVPQFQKSAGTKKPKASKLATLTKAASKAVGANKRDLQSDAVAELLISGDN